VRGQRDQARFCGPDIAERHRRGEEAALQPLLRVYGPWGASARVSYPYSRLVGDGPWLLPDRTDLFDAGGNIREGVARKREAPAGFAPDVPATFEREPGLIDVVALRPLDRRFAPGLHEGILEAVRLELGTRWPPRRRDMAFNAACSGRSRQGNRPLVGIQRS
jgi:hypothetical protein